MRRKPLKKTFVLIALLVMGLIGWGIFLFQRGEASLLDKSQLIVSTKDWDTGEFGYAWLSKQEILFLKYDPSSPPNGIWSFWVYNTQTKNTSPLEHLTRYFNKVQGHPANLQVAPNGEWVLWSFWAGERQAVVAVSTRSDKRMQWWLSKQDEVRWLGARGQWVALRPEPEDIHAFTKATLYHVEQLKPGPTFSIPANSPLQMLQPVHTTQQTSLMLDGGVFMIDLPNLGEEELFTEEPFQVAKMTVQEGVLFQEYTLPIPVKGSPTSRAYSPDGAALAWFLKVKPVEPPWYLRWIPWVGKNAGARSELWIGSLDGKRQQRIGTIVESHNSQQTSPPWVTTIPQGYSLSSALQWHPDGKHLSFLYEDGLYLVEAK